MSSRWCKTGSKEIVVGQLGDVDGSSASCKQLQHSVTAVGIIVEAVVKQSSRSEVKLIGLHGYSLVCMRNLKRLANDPRKYYNRPQ